MRDLVLIGRILPPTARLLAANCKSDPAVVRTLPLPPSSRPDLRVRPPPLIPFPLPQLRGRHLITVELFINRGGLTCPELRRIQDCPVKMLWASEDVAYSIESMREKKRDLDEGGLEVELITIEGAPHVHPADLPARRLVRKPNHASPAPPSLLLCSLPTSLTQSSTSPPSSVQPALPPSLRLTPPPPPPPPPPFAPYHLARIDRLLSSFILARFPAAKRFHPPEPADVESPFERFLDPPVVGAAGDGSLPGGPTGSAPGGGEEGVESDEEEIGGWV